MSALLVLLIHAVAASANSAFWWFDGILGPPFVSQAVSLINAHRDIMNGAYVYVPGVVCDANGVFTPPTGNDVSSILGPIVGTGIEVGVSMNIADAAMESGNCVKAVPAIAAWMKQVPITRFNFDYEPQNVGAANPANYINFLQKMSAAAHSIGKSIDMCLGGNSYFTPYKQWANAGVDRIQSMGMTYKDRQLGYDTVKQMISIFPKSKIVVGIGSMVSPPSAQRWAYNWNEKDLTAFVQFLRQKNIQYIGIFRADITVTTADAKPWFYDQMRAYVKGSTVESLSSSYNTSKMKFVDFEQDTIETVPRSHNTTEMKLVGVEQDTSLASFDAIMKASLEAEGACSDPGVCGRSYQACCIAFGAKGYPCGCKLEGGGTGTAGSNCGDCGTAFAACCIGYHAQGSPCTCDLK